MKPVNNFRIAIITLSTLLAACTSIPDDAGVGDVESLIAGNLSLGLKLPDPRTKTQISLQELDGFLQKPLSVEDAEKLAMEFNPALKIKLLQVGIAEADYAQAGRMENPGFSYERFSGQDYSASLLFDIGGLLLMPLKRQMQLRQLESTRYQTAADVLEHIATTRKAWINAVAEKQQTQLMVVALESAETGNNLARQMSALGHSSVIEAADSEIFLGEMRASLSRQRLAESAAKEALIRQLGLWGVSARSLKLPDRLPALPQQLSEFESAEKQAIENRLDVRMANFNVESMASNLKLSRRSPFLSSIELGPTIEKSEEGTERGFELEFRIPIFDAGGIKNQKNRFIYEQAQAQAEVTAIVAVSTTRQALAVYRTSFDIARHMQDSLLPLRQRISQEKLLRYNGMLISVFDLLDDLRAAMSMESGYIDAIRDFWLADANLQQALTGSGMADMNFEAAATMPSAGGKEH